MVTSIIR
ncbi:putative hemoglobin and hemoglobin-haptoglobin-binding protein 2 precursor, partial [Haemophilus influenzae]